MLTTDNASALVGGPSMAQKGTMMVRVVRGVLDLERRHRAPGEVLTVPHWFGQELIVNRKAEAYVPPPEVQQRPVTLAGTAVLHRVPGGTPSEKGARTNKP